MHLPKRHLASQPLSPRAYKPSWINSKGTRLQFLQACPSPSIACSPSCLAFTRRGASSRTKFSLAQQLRKPPAAASIASRLAAVRGGGWMAHPPHMQLANTQSEHSQSSTSAAAMSLAENFHTHPPIFIWLINRSRPRPGGRGQIHPIEA